MELFDSIVKAFNEVTSNPSNWLRDSLIDTMSLTQAILNFEFALTLRIVERYMSFTESLTQALDTKAIDILQAVEHVSKLTKILSDARFHVDIQFHAIYERASRHAQIYNLAPQTPRRCVRQAG